MPRLFGCSRDCTSGRLASQHGLCGPSLLSPMRQEVGCQSLTSDDWSFKPYVEAITKGPKKGFGDLRRGSPLLGLPQRPKQKSPVPSYGGVSGAPATAWSGAKGGEGGYPQASTRPWRKRDIKCNQPINLKAHNDRISLTGRATPPPFPLPKPLRASWAVGLGRFSIKAPSAKVLPGRGSSQACTSAVLGSIDTCSEGAGVRFRQQQVKARPAFAPNPEIPRGGTAPDPSSPSKHLGAEQLSQEHKTPHAPATGTLWKVPQIPEGGRTPTLTPQSHSTQKTPSTE